MKKILVIFALLLVTAAGCFAFIQSGIEIQEQRGCCSHHGGVAYCGKYGYFICNDGTQSPSCRCR